MERGPATCSRALPCKSFEPIGRHVRTVRVTLQDCRPCRLGDQPYETSRYRGSGLSLHLTSRHDVSYASSNAKGSPVTRCAEASCEGHFRPERAFQKLPELSQKFAVSAGRFPDIPKKIPVRERRELAAKSLIVRTEVRAGFAKQATFVGKSL